MSSFLFIKWAICINWIKPKAKNDLQKIDKIKQLNWAIRFKIYSKYENWKINDTDNQWLVLNVYHKRYFMAKNKSSNKVNYWSIPKVLNIALPDYEQVKV